MLSRPQLGVATWTFGERPLAEIAPIVAEMDYDGVELLADLERTTADTAGRILAAHNLTPFALRPANVDLAHPEAAVRQAALAAYRQYLDFAAALGQPLVMVRPYVGRVRPLTTLAEEHDLLVTAVQQLAGEAQNRRLKLALAVLNRYETHLLNTAAAGIAFLDAIARDNVGLALGAFHMNIEEQDAAGAMRRAGERLWLYHMADSNRQAIGRGHIKLGAHLWALEDIGYTGPIIMECMAPGPDPFTPIKDEDSRPWLETYLRESRRWF